MYIYVQHFEYCAMYALKASTLVCNETFVFHIYYAYYYYYHKRRGGGEYQGPGRSKCKIYIYVLKYKSDK